MRRFKSYTIDEYLSYLRSLKITRKISEVHLHHTWKPTKKGYETAKDKEKVIWGMWQYHTQTNGWQDIGQHVSISPDGLIWDGRDINVIPSSIQGRNSNGFAIEMIGDFDVERLEGVQLDTVIKLIRGLFEIFKTDKLVFHREHAPKTCPGTSIQKDWLLSLINKKEADAFTLALNKLQEKGIISSPDYWKLNAVEGGQCKGEYVRQLIINMSK